MRNSEQGRQRAMFAREEKKRRQLYKASTGSDGIFGQKCRFWGGCRRGDSSTTTLDSTVSNSPDENTHILPKRDGKDPLPIEHSLLSVLFSHLGATTLAGPRAIPYLALKMPSGKRHIRKLRISGMVGVSSQKKMLPKEVYIKVVDTLE